MVEVERFMDTVYPWMLRNFGRLEMADSVKQRAREFTEKAANVVANTYMIGALSYQGHRPKEMVPKLIEMILPSMAVPAI